MKCHAGIDEGMGDIYSIEATAANIHNITESSKPIRSDDEVIYRDAGYLGIEKHSQIVEDEHKSKIDYRIASVW